MAVTVLVRVTYRVVEARAVVILLVTVLVTVLGGDVDTEVTVLPGRVDVTVRVSLA